MNAVVLVLAECHIQWQRTSGGIYFIAMYWELTMLCHFKLIKDRHKRRHTDGHPQYISFFVTAQLIMQ